MELKICCAQDFLISTTNHLFLLFVVFSVSSAELKILRDPLFQLFTSGEQDQRILTFFFLFFLCVTLLYCFFLFNISYANAFFPFFHQKFLYSKRIYKKQFIQRNSERKVDRDKI